MKKKTKMSKVYKEDGASSLLSTGEISNELIDVSYMDFDNQETWLLDVNSDIKGVDNLKIWLKTSSLESETVDIDPINDSKKFIDTRTWTRPKKKFNRMSFESIIEMSSLHSLNSSENQCPNNRTSRIEINFNEKTSSVPSILRPSVVGSCSLVPASGQGSLDAFLNMSQTKGVDSFINMEVPDFNDTLVSNKSLYYGSSLDEDPQVINQTSEMVDSQILTDSMMQTSMFSDITDVNINDAFARDLSNASVIENPNYRSPRSLNSTIMTSSMLSTKPINSTFTTNELREALDTKSFVINNHSFDAETHEINHFSYIVSSECNEECNDDDDDHNHDDNNGLNDVTVIEENEIKNLNSTFDTDGFLNVELNEKPEQLNTTFVRDPAEELPKQSLNTTIQITQCDLKSTNHLNNKPKINVNNRLNNCDNECMNSTYVSTDVTLNRRRTFRVDEHSEQVEQSTEQNIPLIENRFNTYRKSTTINKLKLPTLFKSISTDTEKNVDTEKQVKSCENLLDIKRAPGISRKLESNRNLSRLPQHLQKSNPNLISNSLKTVNPNRISTFGFNRQKAIKNNEQSLTKTVYSLGKLKSGSDQRLAGPKVGLKFSTTGGSTESIESTQSAASAPDLDDRLSVCSDGSNSCRSGSNIDEIDKNLKIKSNNVTQTDDTTQIGVEKCWFPNENSLPSPILKDTDTHRIGSSPGSLNSDVKTSSPILSPAESLQSLNSTTTVYVGTKTVMGPPESLPQKRVLNTEIPKREVKTGIRPPSARGISGIPRPASRIPAPRFSRPSINKI